MSGEPGGAEQTTVTNTSLRIDTNVWGESVRRTVAHDALRYQDGLSHNHVYLIPEGDAGQSERLTEQFNRRVDEVKQHFFGMGGGGEEERALAMTLRFSPSPTIQPIDWRREGLRPDDRWVAERVREACAGNDWKGDVEIDFGTQGAPVAMESLAPRFSGILHELAREGRRVLLVIDGYGEEALRRGFLMMQSFVQPFGDEYRQVMIRAAHRQQELDASLGSPWINAQWDFVSTRSQPKFLREPRPFDEKAFDTFAGEVVRGMGHAMEGGRPEIEFAYGFGKTTMLRSLAEVMKGWGILVGEVGEGADGGIVDLETGMPYREKGPLTLAILNEVDREGGARAIAQIEAQGVPIVRIRPPREKSTVDG